MKYIKFEIKNEYKNIYYFLKDNKFSENYISNLRKDINNIKVNGEKTNIRHPLKINDVLEININPNKQTSIQICKLPLDIVYEDDYYILINKPSGLSCMPNRSHYMNNLSGAICYYMQKEDEDFTLRIINRLDKDTSGLILVAKDSISQQKIKNINKEYSAICLGKIKNNLIIDLPITTINNNGINIQKRIIDPKGKPAITYVKPIKSNDNLSLIKLHLINGRTHQIRLHLSSISHPLLGDTLYGKPSNLINHTALICSKLSFFHPFLNKEISFEIDLPKDIKDILKSL